MNTVDLKLASIACESIGSIRRFDRSIRLHALLSNKLKNVMIVLVVLILFWLMDI